MNKRAFTLIETMVAVTLLSVAIMSPITLVQRSLQSAYYARDQITASYLGQEAIEAVRAKRDNNRLEIRNGSSIDQFAGIPIMQDFLIDTRSNATWTSGCVISATPLKTNGSFYGYGTDPCNASEAGWSRTHFQRTVRACYAHTTGNCDASSSDEIRVTSTMTWTSGVFGSKSIMISESIYRLPI